MTVTRQGRLAAGEAEMCEMEEALCVKIDILSTWD
jgi:hypothetical protein